LNQNVVTTSSEASTSLPNHRTFKKYP